MELEHLYEHARKSWENRKAERDADELDGIDRVEKAIANERAKAYRAIQNVVADLVEYADLSGNDFNGEIDILLPNAAPITILLRVVNGEYLVMDQREKGEYTLHNSAYLVKARAYIRNLSSGQMTWGYEQPIWKHSFSRDELFECIGYALEVYRTTMDKISERMEKDNVQPFGGDAVKYVSDLAKRLSSELNKE